VGELALFGFNETHPNVPTTQSVVAGYNGNPNSINTKITSGI
jgi:hypothetical protein